MTNDILYELQIGKTMCKEENIKRFSIRMTEKEKIRFEKIEKIVFEALQTVVGLIFMIVAVLAMWFLISFFILVAG